MTNIMLVINIVTSYIVWIVFVKLFYRKIKNILVFVIFTVTIYALIPLHYILVHGALPVLIPVLLEYILVLGLCGGRNFLQTVLIPLPIILTSVYLLVV